MITKNKFNLIGFFFIVIFILPITFYGIIDLEEYKLGYANLKIYYNFPLSFLIDYIDFYGPGVKLPIGHFPVYHPTNILIFNTQLHFFFYYFINILIQFIFFKKIFLKIFGKENFIIFFVIFSISNFNYSYSDDWPAANFSFTIFFPTFYYWLKFLQKKDNLSFYKFVFFISFGFLNGHLGHLSMHYIFLLIFTIFNSNFFFLKQGRFYFGLLLCLVICSPVLFYLFSEFFIFDSNLPPTTQPNYSLKQFLFSPLSPYLDIGWPHNRRAFYGIFVLVAVLMCIKNIKNFNNSKKIFHLDKIFLIFVLLSLTSFSKYFYVISGIWNFRDIYNIISLLLIFYFFIEKKTIFNLLVSIQIFFLAVFIIFNFNYLDKNKSNFIVNQKVEPKIFGVHEDFNYGLYKTYFSPKVYSLLRNGFKNDGIYAVTDLFVDNYSPFNGWFKNYSVDDFQTPETKMHGRIDGNYDDLNNVNFLKNFLVGEIVFFESEIPKINIEKFKIIKKIKWRDETIIFARIKGNGFPILKNEHFDYSNCKKNQKKIKCLIEKNTFQENITIKKISLNNIQFQNNTSKEVNIIFPFSDINNWNSKTSVLKKDFNFKRIGILKLKKNEISNFIYIDKLRVFLKVFSLLVLLLLIFYIIKKHEKI